MAGTNIDSSEPVLALYNSQSPDAIQFYPQQTIVSLEDNDLALFLTNLASSEVAIHPGTTEAHTLIEGALFDSIWLNEPELRVTKKQFETGGKFFFARRALVKWFLSRGNVSFARITAFPNAGPLQKLIEEAWSRIILLFVFMSVSIGILTLSSDFSSISVAILCILFFPTMNLLSALRPADSNHNRKSGQAWNLLLQTDLMTPKILLSMISCSILLISSSTLIELLEGFSETNILLLTIMSLIIITCSWSYYFFKSNLPINLAFSRGFEQGCRLILNGLLLAFIISVVSGLSTYNIFPAAEVISFSRFRLTFSPSFVVVNTLFCSILTTLIYFILEDKSITS